MPSLHCFTSKLICDPPALPVEVMKEVTYNFNKVPTLQFLTLQWGFVTNQM